MATYQPSSSPAAPIESQETAVENEQDYGSLVLAEFHPESYRDYEGSRGYNQMIEELGESIAREFPELDPDQNLYILNNVGPIEEEISLAAEALGVSPEDISNSVRRDFPGVDFPNERVQATVIEIERANGSSAWLAIGEALQETDLNPNVIQDDARVILEEVGHALLSISHPNYQLPDRASRDRLQEAILDLHEEHGRELSDMEALPLLSSDNREMLLGTIALRRFQETFAETFSSTVLVNNGASREWFIDQRQAQADIGQLSGIVPYDPSEELEALQSLRPDFFEDKPEQVDYRVTGLREVFDASFQATKLFEPTSWEQAFEDFAHARVSGIAESLVSDMPPEQVIEWYQDRIGIIRDSAQAMAGIRHLSQDRGSPDFNPNYQEAQPGVESIEQAAGRAFQLYQQTRSEEDRLLASHLLESAITMGELGYRRPTNLTSGHLGALIQSPELPHAWAGRLSQGEPIDEVAGEILRLFGQ